MKKNSDDYFPTMNQGLERHFPIIFSGHNFSVRPCATLGGCPTKKKHGNHLNSVQVLEYNTPLDARPRLNQAGFDNPFFGNT